jgi:hypothetical protein
MCCFKPRCSLVPPPVLSEVVLAKRRSRGVGAEVVVVDARDVRGPEARRATVSAKRSKELSSEGSEVTYRGKCWTETRFDRRRPTSGASTMRTRCEGRSEDTSQHRRRMQSAEEAAHLLCIGRRLLERARRVTEDTRPSSRRKLSTRPALRLIERPAGPPARGIRRRVGRRPKGGRQPDAWRGRRRLGRRRLARDEMDGLLGSDGEIVRLDEAHFGRDLAGTAIGRGG